MSEKTLKIIERALDILHANISRDESITPDNKARMLELIEQAQSEVEEQSFNI